MSEKKKGKRKAKEEPKEDLPNDEYFGSDPEMYEDVNLAQF